MQVPRAKAVMFCLMDVSASMGEREKELAKRFFILLHLFLKRKYERVDIVFIRHTDEAAEVDEQEFFYGRETGGTVVSSALKAMMQVREARYPVSDWNVYCAQASDGDNSGSDRATASRSCRGASCRSSQYYAYIEIADEESPARPRRQGTVARLCGPEGGRAGLRHGARRRARRHLSRLPQAVRQAASQGSRAMTNSLERDPHRCIPGTAAVRRRRMGLRHHPARLRRHRHDRPRRARPRLLPNQIEIISAEQMLDAYSSVGMPLMYAHWSYGKRFARDEALYRKGYTALAYEIVINSNPCISYCMEENTMAMQTLVIAHAAFGHNHFFKNNYLFQQWTDPAGILDYLDFAKRYVAACEERYGVEAVERDARCGACADGPGRVPLPAGAQTEPRRIRAAPARAARARGEGLSRPLAHRARRDKPRRGGRGRRGRARAQASLRLPEENLLYFLEKNRPKLKTWQRELLRIVRNIAQYFYPQRQTKVMNEGCASFVHYTIVNRLYDKGLISEGVLLEILHSHANVVAQFDYDDQRFSGFNPYALGFAMMQDIRRICEDPDDEDRAWFPDIAGSRTGRRRCATPGPITATNPSSASSCRRASSASSACSRSPTSRPIRM